MKEWYQSKELVGLSGFPATPQGVNKKAKAERWLRRKAQGIEGRAYEYHLFSFPTHIQLELCTVLPIEWVTSDLTQLSDDKRLFIQLILEADDALLNTLYNQVIHKGMESMYATTYGQ